MDISQPHDSFFRFVISKVERAAGLLQHYLPPEIAEQLVMESIEPQPDTFIEAHLKSRFSDALFSIQTREGNPVFVFMLIDHKSSPDPDVSLQFLRYYNLIWERQRKNQPGLPLPPIISMVIYHGNRHWNCGDGLHSMLNCTETFYPYLPIFRFVLVDLSASNIEKIYSSAELKAALMLMKYILHPKLNEYLPDIIRIVKAARHQPDFLSFFEKFMLYLVKYLNQEHHIELEKLVQSELTEEGDHIMPSIADKLIEQGCEKGIEIGREEGREEGRKLGLIKLLEMKFQTHSEALSSRIMAVHDITVLDTVTEYALTSENLVQFEERVKAVLPH